MIQVPEPDGAVRAALVVLSETDAYFTCPDEDIRENTVINSDAIPQYILILKGDKSQQTFFVGGYSFIPPVSCKRLVL